jgi:hypothetical protein
MKIATISWSEIKGEGAVVFDDKFETLHPTTKLDVIQDTLHALNEKYNELLQAQRKGKK